MVNLDIVIANWNSSDQLSDCLRSIQGAASGTIFQLSKCIVVDNASSDGSADGLGDFLFPLAIIRNTENKGFGAACNQGAKLGNGKYILFLNPDIRLFPDSLEKALLILEDPHYGQIGILGIQLVDENGNIQRNTARFPTPGSLLYQMIGLDRLWPSCFPPYAMTNWNHLENKEVEQTIGAFLLVRRNVYEELGGFDERFFMYYEDVDFAYRARLAGWKTYYFAGTQAFHRGGGTSEQIKAGRLSYWMTSRLHYVAKHFGRIATWAILVASLGPELWARVGWNLINFSGPHLAETLDAYRAYLKSLPQLLRDWNC